MKKSKYNIEVSIGNRTVLFNTLTLNKVIFKDYEYDNLISKILLNPSLYINKYPSIFRYLKRNGFITNYNELDIVKARNIRETDLNDQYHITINPTLECNFNCWYCSVHTAVNDKKILKGRMTYIVRNSIIRHLEDVCIEKKYKSIYIDWFGGEPLLYLNEIIEPLALEIHKITSFYDIEFVQMITTNGFLINETIVKNFNKLKINRFQITLDGDEKKHNLIRNENGKKTFAVIIKNILLINKKVKDSIIYLRINYDNKTLDNIDSVFSILSSAHDKSRIIIYFIGVWQVNHKSITYKRLKEAISKLKKDGFSTKLPKYKPDQYISCYADRKSYLVINYDGKLYKCTARDYSEYHSIGKIDKNGVIKYNTKNKQYYSKNVFNNSKCLSCEILPICMGGCIQKLYEENIENKPVFNSYCFKLNQSDYSIEDFVKDSIIKYE